MDHFHFLPLFALLLNLAVAGNRAAFPVENYWKSVFPDTPMPKALQNLLKPAPAGNMKALADMVHYNTKVTDVLGIYFHYQNPSSRPKREKPGNMKALPDSVKEDTEADGVVDSIGRSHGGYSKPSSRPGGNNEALADSVKEYASINGGSRTARGNKGFGNKDAAADGNMIFFFENQLRPGRRLKVKEILKTRNRASFLPRPVAESIPFSSEKVPEILKYFSLEAKSEEANLIKETIQNCEIPAITGEERYCATSLESLVDWSVSEFGKNIQVLSNEVEKETENQEFTIAREVKKMGEKEIVCHKMKYAYAVFLCHSIEKTSAYSVPMVGADGTKAKLLAICHKDTSAWSPDHLAFQILKVKPGTVPICHFLTKETLVWVPN